MAELARGRTASGTARWPASTAPADYPEGGIQLKEAAVEWATLDRIQQLIDAETAERFPADTAPRLALLHHGDEPVIEPGELYLRVIVGQDFAARQTWMEEHADQLWDFRAQRLPEIKGLLVTADAPGAADRGPTGTLTLTDISLLDPEQDEIARGLTPVVAHLGPAARPVTTRRPVAPDPGNQDRSSVWLPLRPKLTNDRQWPPSRVRPRGC